MVPSFDRTTITAVVLAGGKGSRMGGLDKSKLLWQGRPFIDHIAAALTPQASQVVVNRSQSGGSSERLIVIPDPWPDQRGPLAGVLAALEYSKTPYTLVVPCDDPRPPADLAQRLWPALHGPDPADVAYAAQGKEHHFLYALLRQSAAPQLRAYLEDGGGAVHRWYDTISATPVAFPDDAHFTNANRPEDVATMRAGAFRVPEGGSDF